MTNADDDALSDFQAFKAYRDPLVADRVIGAAMTRVSESPIPRAEAAEAAVPMRVLADVSALWYPALAAAALVAIVAGLAVTNTPAAASSSPRVEAQVRDWLSTGHVPTNRDILTTFSTVIR